MAAASGRLCVVQRLYSASRPSISCYHEMPQYSYNPPPYKGIPYEEIRKIRKESINPSLLTYYKKPFLVHHGSMQWLFDHKGNRYLDLFGGIVTVSVGHSHPKVNTALKDQIEMLWNIDTCSYMHPKLQEYAEKLASRMPGNLKCVLLTNSGSEANERAMMMARLYTKAYKIVTFRNAYHGASPSTMGLTALSTWAFPTPLRMGVVQAMNPDPFRGPWGGNQCRDSKSQPLRDCSCKGGSCLASVQYVEQFEDVLKHSCPKKIAGFFAEPIQGVGGSVQYPRGFMQKAYELVRERGGLCIADEVQTGFGRCGSHYWGFQNHDVIPDIVTMAKGIGNGFPIGAIVTTPEIAATLSQAEYSNTFGGNPLACSVGSAILDVIDEENLQANCAQVGDVFLKGLMELRDEFEIVGDVRGKGLMLALEFVENKATRKPLAAAEVNEIFELTKENGILVGKGGLYGSVFRIKPPMCLTEEDAKFAVFALRNSILQYIETRK